ncbi:hypothetical protein MKW92_013576 [Papaver armeniacum]|nr:hypothetical protein MKW92_013576 [Papaver armeniacum]
MSYQGWIPIEHIYVVVGVLVHMFVFFLLIGLFKQPKSDTIFLVRLSGNGKTVLFYHLRDGSAHKGTIASLDPNEGNFVVHSLHKYLPQAAVLIFVMDALDFLPTCHAAAEYLYEILTYTFVVKMTVPGKASRNAIYANDMSIKVALGVAAAGTFTLS